MWTYIARRILITIPIIIGVTLIVFSIMRLKPGDPAVLMLGDDATEEAVLKLRHDLGLDKPYVTQYLIYLKNLLRGDLGVSLWNDEPVLEMVWNAFKNTIVLTLASLLLSVTFGIGAGILSAVKPNSYFDKLSMCVVLFGQSMPPFWLGLLLILFFSVKLRLLPAGDMYPYHSDAFTAMLPHLILPAVTLALRTTAIKARLTRSSLLEVLHQQYIVTARSKGLSSRSVIFGHAMKNAMIPVITVIGANLGYLLGGAVVIEIVFAWPGIGSLIIRAIKELDYTVVQGGLLFIAAVFAAVNMLVDITYAFIDPRISYK